MAVEVDFGLDIADPSTYWPTLKSVTGAMLGLKSPGEQLIASAVVAGVALVSSTVSFGATLIIFFFALVMFAVGLIRLALAALFG